LLPESFSLVVGWLTPEGALGAFHQGYTEGIANVNAIIMIDTPLRVSLPPRASTISLASEVVESQG
jgi:hypothetical protein